MDSDASFTATLTDDALARARPLLQQACISRHRTTEAVIHRFLGIADERSKWPWATLLVVGALASATLAFAAALDQAFVWCGILISVALVFLTAAIAHLVLGIAGVRAVVHRYLADPWIRFEVNLQIKRTARQLPITVTYRFSKTSYTASVPDLKFERVVQCDDTSEAVASDAFWVLFNKGRLTWNGAIYAPDNKHREIVREFLRRNQIPVHTTPTE